MTIGVKDYIVQCLMTAGLSLILHQKNTRNVSGDKLVTKGTYAKMARGEMVRYMAEKEIENPADVQTFDRLGYNFRRDLSSEIEYVFERKIME